METKREITRIALGMARETEDGYETISKQTGIPGGSLRAFASTGHLGKSRLESLQQWLQNSGYMTTVKREFSAGRPVGILCQETRALLDALESPDFTVEYKMKRFGAFIAFFHAEIDSINVALKKGKE